MIEAADFTSLWIPGDDANAAARLPAEMKQLAASGISLAVMGFDDSPASDLALSAALGAGMAWSAYRYGYWNLPVTQPASAIQGIHDFSPDEAHLPLYFVLDCEENYDANGNISIRAPANPPFYLHQLMDYVESRGITPNDKVKPVIYTRLDWWLTFCPGYTEPADRGWGLWTSEPGRGTTPDTCQLYANWARQQVVGVQTALNVDSPIGQIDRSVFRDIGAPAPPGPGPLSIVGLSASVRLSDGSLLAYPAA